LGAIKPLIDIVSSKYQIMEILGKGSYGFVAKGKCRITNRVVALKIMID